MKRKGRHLAINGGSPICSEIIPIHKPVLEADDIRSVTEALETTFVSGDGPSCREFEEKLKKYLGVKHALFTNSCTGALDLAYLIKEFPPGSEVIVPNFTYTSTALAPLLNNLKVVLVDVNPENGNIDVSKIEEAINSQTVAISPVDYAGNPVDMDPIIKLANKHGLYIVQDSAQSIGAYYKGKRTGNQADVSCFSFHGTKNIITGEGGALVTDNDQIAEKIKIARDKGTDKYKYIADPAKKGFYEYVSMGNSYVQSNILGALGVSQLNKADRIMKRRTEIADYYLDELASIEKIRLPAITPEARSNWHIFYILVPPADKSWILNAIIAEGVSCNIHYSPLHMNKLYADLEGGKELKNSIQFYNSLIRIPIYPALTDSEVELIVKAIHKVCSSI